MPIARSAEIIVAVLSVAVAAGSVATAVEGPTKPSANQSVPPQTLSSGSQMGIIRLSDSWPACASGTLILYPIETTFNDPSTVTVKARPKEVSPIRQQPANDSARPMAAPKQPNTCRMHRHSSSPTIADMLRNWWTQRDSRRYQADHGLKCASAEKNSPSNVQQAPETASHVQAGYWMHDSQAASQPKGTEPPAKGTESPVANTPATEQRCVSGEGTARCGVCGWIKHRWNDRWKPCLQEKWWGYADEFEEQPLGASLHAHRDVQVAKGEAAQMVLYRYDFADGTSGLSSRGKRQLKKIAEMLPKSFAPVIVEETDNAKLDEQRRQLVYSELAKGSFPVPPERVVVGPPRAAGLSGSDAEILNKKFTQQTSSGGATSPTGISGGNALGGASAGSGTSTSGSGY